MADEPVSRILLAAIARHLTIIPLGRNSRYDSSSLPEGCSRQRQQALKLAPRSRERRNVSVAPPGEPGRLSPPIWPCTTRGFPCLACCQTSGGPLPHLFTLTDKALLKDDKQVSLPPVTEANFGGGLFSVALSVTRPIRRTFVRTRGSVPWRYQARCPFVFARAAAKRPPDADRCPDFPPAALRLPYGIRRTSQRSSSSPAISIIFHFERIDGPTETEFQDNSRYMTNASTKPRPGC